MLPKRTLGTTGMDVSILGLGTVKLGRNTGVKYPQGFTLPNDREARQLIDIAREQGINLIDTAPAYGTSEERLGTLLKDQRQDWLICTKVGEEFVDGRSTFNFTPEHTRISVERSLRRLNTDVLDIVLIHSDGNDTDILRHYGTLEALADLKAEGKIRATGMSTKTLEGGLLAAEQTDIVMVTWNAHYNDDLPIIDYCQKHNKGVLIKKALASGHCIVPSNTATDAITDPVTRAFKTIFTHPGVNSAIVGTINPAHLLANIAAAQDNAVANLA